MHIQKESGSCTLTKVAHFLFQFRNFFTGVTRMSVLLRLYSLSLSRSLIYWCVYHSWYLYCCTLFVLGTTTRVRPSVCACNNCDHARDTESNSVACIWSLWRCPGPNNHRGCSGRPPAVHLREVRHREWNFPVISSTIRSFEREAASLVHFLWTLRTRAWKPAGNDSVSTFDELVWVE